VRTFAIDCTAPSLTLCISIHHSVRPSVRHPFILSSFHPFILSSFHPSILPSFHPTYLPSVLPSVRPSFLPSVRHPFILSSYLRSIHPSVRPSRALSWKLRNKTSVTPVYEQRFSPAEDGVRNRLLASGLARNSVFVQVCFCRASPSLSGFQ
jgi:hypothetical protein